jgi:hypothetical protein
MLTLYKKKTRHSIPSMSAIFRAGCRYFVVHTRPQKHQNDISRWWCNLQYILNVSNCVSNGEDICVLKLEEKNRWKTDAAAVLCVIIFFSIFLLCNLWIYMVVILYWHYYVKKFKKPHNKKRQRILYRLNRYYIMQFMYNYNNNILIILNCY